MTPDNDFSAEDLLSTIEGLSLLTFDLLGSGVISEEYLTIESVSFVPGDFTGRPVNPKGTVFTSSLHCTGQSFRASSLSGVVSTVEVPGTLLSNGSSSAGLAVSHIPTIAPFLPLQLTFEPEHNLTVGGAVMSVQVEGILPPSPLPIPITITFGYIEQVS